VNAAADVRVIIVAGLVGPTRCRKALVIRTEPRTFISYQIRIVDLSSGQGYERV